MEFGPAYQRWWELHLRVARGDSLSAEDRAVCDATRRALEESEVLVPLQDAKRARDELREWEVERRRLEARRQELDAEIAAIESASSR